MRILVVEDDKDVGAFIVKGLKEAGHVVEHAATGRDGLFLAASEAFDAIVLDRMLPGGVDGLRLLETLRSQGNATPVLFLSALAQVDERVKGLKAGGDDYMTKPFSFAELLARVEALTRRGRRRADDQARGGGPGDGSAVAQREARRQEGGSAAPRIPPPRIPDAPCRPGRDPHDAARGGVGLSFRSANQRDRCPCLAPAAKGGQALSDAVDPYRAQCGVYAAARGAVRREQALLFFKKEALPL